MNEDQNQLQQRLNRMKAINFSQERQANLVRKVFDSWRITVKQNTKKYKEYYNMILCLKSFKGIMEQAIVRRQQQESARIKQQQLIHSYQKLSEDQLQKQLIQQIINNRKVRQFRKFCQHTKRQIHERKDKQSKIQEQQKRKQMSEYINRKIDKNQTIEKYQQPFSAERLFQSVKNEANFLESSRRSIQTSKEDFQKKRKYAAIKTLPPKPIIPLQHKVPQQIHKIKEHENKDTINIQRHNKEPNKKDQQIINKTIEIINSQELIQQKKQKQTIVKQQSSITILKIKKDEILALLAQLKMIEIMQITEIIQQKEAVFKHQTNLSEKQYTKSSLKLLQKISLIN